MITQTSVWFYEGELHIEDQPTKVWSASLDRLLESWNSGWELLDRGETWAVLRCTQKEDGPFFEFRFLQEVK